MIDRIDKEIANTNRYLMGQGEEPVPDPRAIEMVREIGKYAKRSGVPVSNYVFPSDVNYFTELLAKGVPERGLKATIKNNIDGDVKTMVKNLSRGCVAFNEAGNFFSYSENGYIDGRIEVDSYSNSDLGHFFNLPVDGKRSSYLQKVKRFAKKLAPVLAAGLITAAAVAGYYMYQKQQPQQSQQPSKNISSTWAEPLPAPTIAPTPPMENSSIIPIPATTVNLTEYEKYIPRFGDLNILFRKPGLYQNFDFYLRDLGVSENVRKQIIEEIPENYSIKYKDRDRCEIDEKCEVRITANKLIKKEFKNKEIIVYTYPWYEPKEIKKTCDNTSLLKEVFALGLYPTKYLDEKNTTSRGKMLSEIDSYIKQNYSLFYTTNGILLADNKYTQNSINEVFKTWSLGTAKVSKDEFKYIHGVVEYGCRSDGKSAPYRPPCI